ncbi:MAG: zinc ABC transporter substrate-binding protein [Actinobacteria bacterium]|nr:zinc ABC transporter substrate-binding protein [Actinomycetota bacterium]
MTTRRSPKGWMLAIAGAGLVAATGLAAAGCGSDSAASTTAPAPDATRAVVTFSILDDVVRSVGGRCVTTTTLVGRDGDAHVFEPTPKDATALEGADVVISNGLGFEPWLADLYASSGSKATTVVAMAGVSPIKGDHDHGHVGEDDHGDDHGDDKQTSDAGEAHEVDPHAWQDPRNMRTAVATVRDALVKASPECAAEIRANAKRYDAELAALDTEIAESVSSLPGDRRIIITNHDSLGYFAKRYGFDVETALGSLTTESADPSAQQIANLAADMRKDGVKAIFVENIGGTNVIDRLAREAGVQVAPPLYTDALGAEGSDGATYLGMMRSNAKSITSGLSGS